MYSPLNGNHHFSVVTNPTHSYFSYFSQYNDASFPSTRQDVQSFQKIRWRKTCAIVEFEPSKIDGHSMVIVLLLFPIHKICTKYSSFLNVQNMCNIIQLNVNISNTHWR